MPTYDFQCSTCKKRFSRFVFMSEVKKQKCPECGGKSKVLWTPNTQGGFVLKGKGWFKKGGY